MDIKILASILCFHLLCPFALGTNIQNKSGIVLLPVEQSQIPEEFQIDEKIVFSELQSQLKRILDMSLVEYSELKNAFEEYLVDEAVFELLITNELHNTMRLLENNDQYTAKIRQYANLASDMEIGYLIRIHLIPDQMRMRVHYEVIDTSTAKVTETKIYNDKLADPLGVSNDLAKNITASLWRANLSN